jgi:hypothetical protein
MKQFDSPTYEYLATRYGLSAGTTYLCLREHGVPATLAWERLKLQVKELGINHPGGSCRVVELRRI